MQISVKSNAKEVLREYRHLSKTIKSKAMVRALNKAGAAADVSLRKRIVKESGLKAKYVKRKVNKFKANGLNLTVTLSATTRHALNLVEWTTAAERNKYLTRSAYQRKTKTGRKRKVAKGVVASAWRKRKTYDGTFIVRGRASGKPVVVTVNKSGYRGKNWSKTIYGPAAWREFSRYSEEEARKAVNKHFNREFERQIRLLDKRR